MRIAICGLIESENLGEKFISDSLSFIIQQTMNEKHGTQKTIEFVEVDLLARNDGIVKNTYYGMKRKELFYHYKDFHLFGEAFYVVLRKLMQRCRSLKIKNTINRFRHFIWKHSFNLKKRYLEYYDHKFKDVDMIIIDGAGLLEYSYNEYQEQLLVISEYAEQHGLNIVYNAIGRAGEFDSQDFRCQILMKAIRSDAVKYVSARDSAEAVQKCAGNKMHVELLADAAFCIGDTYHVSKDLSSELIGIGLIRGSSLQSYHYQFSEKGWITLFSQIATELKNRGYAFQFFTNGYHEDYELGKKVLKQLGLDETFLVQKPVDARDLLRTIASYKGIITCRMHSSIAAFSLGIPSIILNWNDKVKKLMEQLKYPERVIDPQNFKAKLIVDHLEASLREGIDENNQRRIKLLARKSVEDYTDLLSACEIKE